MLRSSIVRASRAAASPPILSRRAAPAALSMCLQQRHAHAISNPTLANIEKRWESMPPQEQAELWMALRDRMKTNWHELTFQEKKAAYWIAFGSHGPRALPPPGESMKIFSYVLVGLGASLALFYAVRLAARPPPESMTREWQEATNEKLIAEKSEPISGISSEGYVGKGMVQSPRAARK